MENPHYNRIKAVLAEKDKTGTWLSEQVGRNIGTVSRYIMATTISVNKQNVLELLSTGRTKPFVIPEYQRPYAWTDEQIETLFEDIWEFAITNRHG